MYLHPPQRPVTRLKRFAASAVAAVALISMAAASTTTLARAPYVKAEKPITDEQGRVQVIIDFTDDAHLEYPGQNQDPQRNGVVISGENFVHKEKTLALVADFERRYGVKRLGITSWIGNSMTALIASEQLDKILAEPLVKQVSDDEEHRFSAFAPPWYNYNFYPEWMSWGGDAVNAKVSTGNTGRKIYIIDSGVAYHDDLPLLPTNRKNVACGNGNCNATDPYNYPLVGCYAHATHVAGIIGATASASNGKTTRGVYAGFPNMVSLNVTERLTGDDCSTRDPVTLTSYIGHALDYISWDNTNNNPNKIIHVVNMSINVGGVQLLNQGAPGANWTKVRTISNGVWVGGIQFVAGALFIQSAGNTSPSNFTDACLLSYSVGPVSPQQPALPSDGIIVVGAVNEHGRAVSQAEAFSASIPANLSGSAGYSAYGKCVDLWAPGDAIVSTWGAHTGPTLSTQQYTGNVYGAGTTGGWGFLSGTSMAAPHVAAVAAWLADMNNPTTSGALETLVRNSSSQHFGAVDAAGFPVKIPRLP